MLYIWNADDNGQSATRSRSFLSVFQWHLVIIFKVFEETIFESWECAAVFVWGNWKKNNHALLLIFKHCIGPQPV